MSTQLPLIDIEPAWQWFQIFYTILSSKTHSQIITSICPVFSHPALNTNNNASPGPVPVQKSKSESRQENNKMCDEYFDALSSEEEIENLEQSRSNDEISRDSWMNFVFPFVQFLKLCSVSTFPMFFHLLIKDWSPKFIFRFLNFLNYITSSISIVINQIKSHRLIIKLSMLQFRSRNSREIWKGDPWTGPVFWCSQFLGRTRGTWTDRARQNVKT